MQIIKHLFKSQARARFIFQYLMRISLVITCLIPVLCSQAQTYPTGFNQVLVANGISNPTVMAFAPDGRLFVAQQSGALRIIQNGILLATPFVTLTVNSSGERGLLGIAFDPSFNTNQFIYLYYTLSTGANNRISRFTANGNVVVPGSELVLLNLDPLSSATNHNGGTIQFGKDGKLYVGIGENANSANAPNLDTYLGKILRINPDGSVPAGNPFTSGTAQKQRIWQYGMRNPYTLSIQPGTGRIFVNDVGQSTWEEVNDCTTGGRNYGWPTAEGNSSNIAFTNPIYTYTHGSGIGVGCAITGGTFFNPSTTNYPSQYTGRYFFLDYCNSWIDMLTLSGSTASRSNFASAIAGSPVCMATGPDGNLYFLSRTNSGVYKITFTSSTSPVITVQPQSISASAGNSANFSVTATGSQPLNYQWKKNTVNINGASNATYTIPSVVLADTGNYSVVVSNTAGSITSNNAHLTVTVANKLPTATINTPLPGATYTAGTTINFSGSGTDPENGNLLASSFNWFVVFHHDAHTHPGPTAPSRVTSGSFVIPNTGESAANVFYRLYLVVTDAQGGKDSAFTDIKPRTSTIILKTNPAGLQITLDGQPFTAPITVTSVEGMVRTIGAPSPQGIYTFNTWSQGGSASQTIATPVNDAVYTANYLTTTVSTLSPLADAYVIGGKNTNYGAASTLVSQKNSTLSKTYETYLKFDISTFNTTITSAVLRLNGKLNSTSTSLIPVQAYNVTNTTWLENTISWYNKPTAQTTVLATTSVSGTTSQYYQWDLTQHIKNLRSSGITKLTLKLINTNSTSNQVVFNSKEATSNKPQLVVTSTNTTSAIQSSESKENYDRPWNITIYPNPVKNILIIQNSSESGPMKIFDLSGRLVKESFITDHSSQQIPVDDLIDGLYIIRIQNEKGVLTKKFVLKK
jgi:glucose/arabinose dehydrogenase